MKGNSPDSKQPSFLLPSLKEQLDPNHPIYQLNERINWSVIEEDFKKLYSHTGRPAKPVRLMVSLLLLKQLEDLSDEQVIRRWVDIPYWQYLSGETHFQWKPPAASSDLTHFRKRIGKKGAERLLKLSIDLFNPKIQKEEVVIDTTVQEKNITYPTDSKLAKKVIDTCRNIAKQEGIPLRQSYSRVTPQLLRQASNRKSPQQKKKARKATRRLQTIGRALVRELVRKMPQKQISPYAQTLLDAWSILLQNKTDKHKIYSLHEPHVSCISKGKAHKPFEFGSKVSISRTRDSGIILGALALPGNPYDGHTVQAALKQIKRIIGKQPEILIADRGYKGQKEFGKTRLLTPSVPLKTDSQYVQRKQRKRFRKRAGLEATISHLKQHFRMGKCYLKGELGDQINVILAAAAYNLRKWIRLRLDPFFVLFLKNLNFPISQHLGLTNPYLRQTFSF